MALTTGIRQGHHHRGILPPVAALLVAVALTAVITILPASGHAEPVQSDPPADATVAEAPARINIRFSEEVAVEGTELTVVAPDGSSADLGDTTIDLDDMERRTVTVGLQPDLEPGTYIVTWQTRSAADDDREEGSFIFNVGHASTPAASPSASPEASPVASPATAEA
ncbi:MAG: copper resistance CopC family protein [Thermomicrobiales bacterium]